MNIELATENDIPAIIEILKQRCEWFKNNNIEQWGQWYYTELYNIEYFTEMIKTCGLYVAKQEDKVVGAFLLKTEDVVYWKDNKKAYYIHHLVTKIGYPNLGLEMLEFIEDLAKKNSLNCLRLDCMKTNIKLNEYYQKRGFECKGEGEEPYPHKLWEKLI